MSDARSAGRSDERDMVPLHELYQEVILDHYRRPRNKRPVEDCTHTLTLSNPLCGDVIDVLLRVQGSRIVEAGFQGRGCSISQASASMMTEKIKGRTIEEALRLAQTFTNMLRGEVDAERNRDLGELRALAGVSKFPVRVKCALLAWNCLEEMVG